jgi:N utilization substance protein A
MRDIPKKVLFEGIESALATAAKKHYPDAEEIQVTIDANSGKIKTSVDGVAVDPPDFGRIAAQTAKQVIIQKVREAHRD